MAKWEGEQNIPAEWLDLWRGTATDKSPLNITRKRYPFRMRLFQEGGYKVTPKQKAQRARFKTAMADFKKETPAERQRWFAAMPEWHSFLWYYNYYIMSDLMGNADINRGGAGVIKSLQYKQISMPAAAGEGQVAITAVDISKSVVMLFGASVNNEEGANWYRVNTIYPYVSSIASELVKCKWSIATIAGENTLAATIGIIIIEYI